MLLHGAARLPAAPALTTTLHRPQVHGPRRDGDGLLCPAQFSVPAAAQPRRLLPRPHQPGRKRLAGNGGSSAGCAALLPDGHSFPPLTPHLVLCRRGASERRRRRASASSCLQRPTTTSSRPTLPPRARRCVWAKKRGFGRLAARHKLVSKETPPPPSPPSPASARTRLLMPRDPLFLLGLF